jgi:hypothetical protein
MPHPAHTDFDTIVGCLRLGRKYAVDYIFRRALVHLSSLYSTTLADSDANVDNETRHASWEMPDISGGRIMVIQLAREVDVPWILPLGFYGLSAFFHAIGTDIFHGVQYKGIPAALSAPDQQTFLKGYAVQKASMLADLLRFVFYPLVLGCTGPFVCPTVRLATMEAVRPALGEDFCNPLDVWGKDDWGLMRGLCPTCLEALKETHKNARQAFWDKLPGIYGLPPWEELEALKSAAISADLTS